MRTNNDTSEGLTGFEEEDFKPEVEPLVSGSDEWVGRNASKLQAQGFEKEEVLSAMYEEVERAFSEGYYKGSRGIGFLLEKVSRRAHDDRKQTREGGKLWKYPDWNSVRRVLRSGEPLSLLEEGLEAYDAVSGLFPLDSDLVFSAKRRSAKRSAVVAGKEANMKLGSLGYVRKRSFHTDQFIVPNPLKAREVEVGGIPMKRCNENVLERRYVIVEFDFEEKEDDGKKRTQEANEFVKWLEKKGLSPQHASLILLEHLSQFGTLCAVVDSAGKSLHGWFGVRGWTDEQFRTFFSYATFLGADRASQTPSQLCRMPGGMRMGMLYQKVLHFNRSNIDKNMRLEIPPIEKIEREGQKKRRTTADKKVDAEVGKEARKSIKGLVAKSKRNQEVWYDGRAYWYESIDGRWRPVPARNDMEDVLVWLLGRGIDDEGSVSKHIVAQELADIRDRKIIEAAGPFRMYAEQGVFKTGEGNFLNTSTVKALAASETGGESWGDGFPFLAKLFGLFGQGELHVRAWVHHAYKSAVAGDFKNGRSMILCGAPKAGKNFFGDVVLGGLMGRVRSATLFLTTSDRYNKELSLSPVWTVHDPEKKVSAGVLKRVTANHQLEVRGMRSDPYTLEWKGRVLVTLNDDPKSLEALPSGEGAVMDKLLVVRMAPRDFDIPGAESIASELRKLAAYFTRHEIPEELQEERFGVSAFVDSSLSEEMETDSTEALVVQCLDAWKAEGCPHVDKRPDKGGAMLLTPGEIYGALVARETTPVFAHAVRSPISLGRYLSRTGIQKKRTKEGVFYQVEG